MSAAGRQKRRSRLGPAGRAGRFVGIAACVAAMFVAAVYALAWVGDHEAESYGNRLLGAPRPEECRLARAIVRDFARQRSADLRRAAGAGDQKLELLAYAWRSDGARTAPGADWRWCPGFGPYVRGLGLERMGSGRWWGPSLYISRAPPAGRSQGGWAWVTFFAPQPDDPRFGRPNWAGSTTWRVVYPASNQPSGPPEWIEVTRRPGQP